MNHYCTYFDEGFLAQGVALWRSLLQHDPGAVLWVLALDDTAATVLRGLQHDRLRVGTLAVVESADPALVAAKANRSRVEYYFTLSPCWPRHLFRQHPEIDRLVYVDADMLFFSTAQPIWDELERGDVLVCAHRFPAFLRHYEKHGVFNVGVLGWRRNENGLACLDWWRERCLEWCHDRLEGDRYADQKYLEQWPRLFRSVVESSHPGINLAPWNWLNYHYDFPVDGVHVDGRAVVIFHFARFRALRGNWWWQSGHLDYGVMTWRLRQALYGTYHGALLAARAEIARVAPDWQPPRRAGRLSRDFWRALPLRVLFGTDWLRIGGRFVSGRFGLGRYSGRCLARLRTIFLRK